MRIGYARVSTEGQNLDAQIDALQKVGVERKNIYTDKASGAKASRPQWDLVLALLRSGDTLVATRLDRVGRSVLHLVNLGAELRERGVDLVFIEQAIDTRTSEGRLMFNMLSALAEFQRELIVANTRDGLAAARARGRVGGRPRKITPAQVELAQRLYDQRNKTVAEIAEVLGVSRTTLHGYLQVA
jgi:DNA invertase Pin-like site-specific DNA recombinase